MELLIFILAFYAFFIYLIIKLIKYIKINSKNYKNTNTNIFLPYKKNNSILTNNELNFYKNLKPIIDKNNYILLIKPRLADFITVITQIGSYYTWFNKISAKHIDFLLCSQNELTPILGIELDDNSHTRIDRKERDMFVDEVFKKIEIPILHIKTIDAETLENQISTLLNIKPN